MAGIYILLSPADCREQGLEIAGASYHHLVHVRRIRVGASLRAALPDGRVLMAEVTEITAGCLRASILGEEEAVGIPSCSISLFQAVLKGEKMDFVVQKATELGVSVLIPLYTQRSIPRWTSEQAVRRTERWQRIADAAAEQCERALPLQVIQPVMLQDVVQTLPADTVLLHEREGLSLQAFYERYPRLSMLGLCIGPEGGWDTNEEASLREVGAIPVHLGRRILRAETAALAAVTLAQFLWGDL